MNLMRASRSTQTIQMRNEQQTPRLDARLGDESDQFFLSGRLH